MGLKEEYEAIVRRGHGFGGEVDAFIHKLIAAVETPVEKTKAIEAEEELEKESAA